MKLCKVANCPAAASGGSHFCQVHEYARSAKELGLGPDKNGLGARSCGKCRRRFKDDDLVQRATFNRRVRATSAATWQHAACELPSPKPTRKEIREAAKPLLSAAADASNE